MYINFFCSIWIHIFLYLITYHIRCFFPTYLSLSITWEIANAGSEVVGWGLRSNITSRFIHLPQRYLIHVTWMYPITCELIISWQCWTQNWDAGVFRLNFSSPHGCEIDSRKTYKRTNQRRRRPNSMWETAS